MKKIDCHMHLIENIHGMSSRGYLRDLGNGCGIYETGDIVRIIPEEYGACVTPELLIEIMDQNDVEFGIMLQGHYAGVQNLYSYEAMKKYPNRLIASAMIDPFYRKNKEIRKNLFENLNIKIIKMEMSNSSGIMCNHPTVDLNGEIMNELYSYIEDKKLILFIDIGRPNNDCYQIDAIKDAIINHPNITFIICHLIAPQGNDLDLFKENINKLKLNNCYFDIASLYNNIKDPYPFLETQKYIKEAINIVGSNKILWGTDFPSAMKNNSYKDSYKYIEESSLLTDEEKNNILYNNAKSLFGELL